MSHTAHVGIRPAWIYLLQLRYSNFQAHRFIFKKDSQQQWMSTSLLPWMKRMVVTSALGAHSRGTEHATLSLLITPLLGNKAIAYISKE